MLQVEYVKTPPAATFSAQLLIIRHWIVAIFSIDLGLSRHLAEGCFAKTPVLLQGGSKTTKSASPTRGKGAIASAMTGWAILFSIRSVSFFHAWSLRVEKSIGVNRATVLHQLGDVGGFGAWSSANIKNNVALFGRGGLRGETACFILNVKQAIPVTFKRI